MELGKFQPAGACNGYWHGDPGMDSLHKVGQ
jgi:hypothetical protein